MASSVPSSPSSPTSSNQSLPHSPVSSPENQLEEKPKEQQGYLGRAVSGVASGIYTVGKKHNGIHCTRLLGIMLYLLNTQFISSPTVGLYYTVIVSILT